MTYYSLADYTIMIDDNGYLYVQRRSDGQKFDDVNLNNKKGKVSKNPNADEFGIIGCDEEDDVFISSVDLNGNTVTMDTQGYVKNIGGSNSIDINQYDALIVLQGGEILNFYQQNI
ncbi:MAG: hypothetical protein SFW35_14225 [Chitinophagales bacterium]|nr:hypothetical protein [Chitinophagales bacterium]